MGFIAMKALAGGLINRSEAAMAFISQYDQVIPIWGIQKENELEEWLGYMEETPGMTEEIRAFIEKGAAGADRRVLPGLRLLYALSCRHPDQPVRQNVPDAAPGAFRSLADHRDAG